MQQEEGVRGHPQAQQHPAGGPASGARRRRPPGKVLRRLGEAELLGRLRGEADHRTLDRMRQLEWFTSLLVVSTACGRVDSPTGDPCAGVDCSSHGVCAALGEAATCICDQGYTNSGLTTCEPVWSGACETTADCDDGDPCTDDLCGGDGICQRTFNASPCDDGIYCNGTDVCDGGGNCLHSGNPCLNDCYDDCDEAGKSCSQPSADGTDCDDGFYCTVGDTCQGGVCTSHQTRDCTGVADGCNNTACDDATASCIRLPKADGTTCVAGNDCVLSACDAGLCAIDISTRLGELCTVNVPNDGECVTVGSSAECRLLVGQNCAIDADCADGNCECFDAGCTITQCSPVDCDCQYNANRGEVCTGPLNRDEDDPEDSCGPLLGCDGVGGCVLGLGDPCSQDSDCDSGFCTCGDDNCVQQICHTSGCTRCQYVTDGSAACQTTPVGNAGEECLPPYACAVNRMCEAAGCPHDVIVVGGGQLYLTFYAGWLAAQDGDVIILLPGTYLVEEFVSGGVLYDKDVDVYGATGNPYDVEIRSTYSGVLMEVRMDLMASASPSPSFSHVFIFRTHTTPGPMFAVHGRPAADGGTFMLENSRVSTMANSEDAPIEVRASNPTIILNNVDILGYHTGYLRALDDTVTAIVEFNSVFYSGLNGGIPFPNGAGLSIVNSDYGTDSTSFGQSQYDTSNPAFPCGWPIP